MKARLLLLALILVSTTALVAQQHITVPQASPHARTQETIGITDVAVDYHRPAVNNRRIFGGLVPYDVIWRAGANENTTLSFSTPVMVEGHSLPAGTYSLFFIPAQPQYTVILNRFTGGWGTYNYDPSEDALRVSVTPEVAPTQERLLYTFDDTKEASSTLSLRWDKVRVPVKITADTTAMVKVGIQNKLRGGEHWDAQAWTEAASWMARNGEADTAMAYVNHSLDLGPNPGNLRLKARLMEKKGDVAAAKELRARADGLAPDTAALSTAYTLIGTKKYDDAAMALNSYVAKNPTSWRAIVAMGDVYAARGDNTKAREYYDKAMSMASGQDERTEVQDSINAMGAGAK